MMHPSSSLSRFRLACLWLSASLANVGALGAQSSFPPNIVAYYGFDDGTADESLDNEDANALVTGAPEASCGAVGAGSLRFDGVGDYLTVTSPQVTGLFENSDFVLSFYFHATSASPRQTLIRKAIECASGDPGLTIDYLQATNSLEVNFVASPERSLGGPDNAIPLNPKRCWQHFVLVRRGSELQFYLNGERVLVLDGGSRFTISNAAAFEIARAGCSATEANFGGFIDEVQLYRGTLSLDEIEALYTPVDLLEPLERIVIDVGDQLDIRLREPTCATEFQWSPEASVVNGVNGPRATVQPEESTMYFLELGYDNSGCRAVDSAFVQVFDPDNFDCTQLLIPAAFSPNGFGPADNERFGISNAATLQEFNSFEVYDRWGTQVFVAAGASDRWDGTFGGEDAPPGVYLWRVSYVCNSEELNRTGSVVLMR